MPQSKLILEDFQGVCGVGERVPHVFIIFLFAKWLHVLLSKPKGLCTLSLSSTCSAKLPVFSQQPSREAKLVQK